MRGTAGVPGSSPLMNGDTQLSEPALTPIEEDPGSSILDEQVGPEDPAQGMIPGRSRRRTKLERASMRILATGGIIGIATALGAVLVGNDVAGWIVGLAVGLTSVVLAAVLWSSKQL
jgi:hypothetical protein